MNDSPWIRPWNYVVKTNKCTSVLYTCVGNFTSPWKLNVIIGKCTHIEILLHTNQGLQPIVEVPIYGQISNLQIFRPIGDDRDSVVLCIARYRFFVLQWDDERNEIIIRATGNLLETTGFEVRDRYMQDEDDREIFIIHPNSRVFGLYSWDKKIFKVVVFDNSWHLNEAFEIRLEFEILDIQFLSGCANPKVVVLYQNCDDDGCMVEIHTLSLEEKVFVGLPWSKNLENGAQCLIPVSVAIGGILVLGETKVVYCSTTAYEEIQITSFTAFERVNEDGYQYLIGDTFGQLHLLTIKHENEKVLGLQMEPLGETSIASTISWLGNECVYVGSSCKERVYVGSSSGDSQLHQKTAAKGACLEVLETYAKLGPIKDFCVVDPMRQGQCQVVTCVGAHKDSSLCKVRNGIYKLASYEMKGIRRMWSLKCSTNDPYYTYLVVSSVSKTQVLAVNFEGNLAKTKIEGFHSEANTLFCHDAVSNQIVQVTERSVRLVSSTSGQLNQEWTDPAGCNIFIATANSSMVLLETWGGRNFYYLKIGDGEVTEIKHKQLDFEIFCLAINSITENSNSRQLAAVGKWKSVQIVSLPDLELIFEVDLSEESIPNSVLFCAFEGISYLLCGLGHGHLLSFMLNTSTGELEERKKISLGTMDIKLGSFSYQSTTSVFAASSRPTFIYSSYKKLRYSMVNMTHVKHMCAFNSAAFPDRLAIYSRDKIIFVAVDGIPTTVYDIPIRLSPLEQASCICYQELSSTYAICTLTKAAGGNNPSPVKGSQIRLLDENFEQITYYELEDFEYGSSILSLSFSEDDNAYYCVGTEYEDPNDSGEEAKGRIMILLVEGGKLKLVCEKETEGGVSSLNSCNGQLLATVSNGCSFLYNWILGDDGTKNLEHEWKRGGTILPIDLQTHGDFISEEELSTACSKQFFKGSPGRELNRVSDSMVIGDGIYLIAEDSYSLFAVRKNGRGASDLEVVGAIHLDEKVNRVRRGSLVTPLLDSGVGQVPTLIFGSENGSMGIIASLPQEEYLFYEKLQSKLRMVLEGGFKNKEWMSLYHGKRSSDAKNFVDGNFIESFYDLNCEDMELLSSHMDVSVDELCDKVLELGSLSVNAFRVQ